MMLCHTIEGKANRGFGGVFFKYFPSSATNLENTRLKIFAKIS